MVKKNLLPRTILWMFLTAFLFLLFMTIARLVFFHVFHPAGYTIPQSREAFLLGLNFDARIACGIVLPPFLLSMFRIHFSGKTPTLPSMLTLGLLVVLCGLVLFFMVKGHAPFPVLIFMSILIVGIFWWLWRAKNCNPFENQTSKRVVLTYFLIASILLPLLYIVDYQHYDYLQQRLNASIINFAGDAKISAGMVMQTYPVFSMLMIIVLSAAVLWISIWLMFRRLQKRTPVQNRYVRIGMGVFFTLLLALGIFGRINQYPLRWSDAFDLEDDFKANLALNPAQSFLSTLQFRHSTYDLQKVRDYYPLMAAYLGVPAPDADNLLFARPVVATDSTKRNVVVVICESFSSYKSSMWGNALNTTPYFAQLCKEGIFFDHCFTPAFGTARGIWATITGIPDVQYPNTASRNPAFVDQHSILNDYEGYGRFYFIGGSLSWANIRGLLSNNIENLQLFEEQHFEQKAVDVWGISDKHLFAEANEVFAKQTKPFVAVIQTADNHRPYTIPEEDKELLGLVSYPADTLEKWGFQSNDELNAFRYMDYSIRHFIEAAKKEAYFSNTIFVFIGDHGLKGNSGDLLPAVYNQEGINAHHVPLLFYSPTLLKPRVHNEMVSQVDLLPSVTALAGISFENTSMGRNLFDSTLRNRPFYDATFLYDPGVKGIEALSRNFFYKENLLSNTHDFLRVPGGEAVAPSPATEDVFRAHQAFARGWYETARYLLHNNRKANKER